MPRILCLHGMGTNATIFRTQLAPLQNLLPPTYDLVFADAPIISSAAPGIAAVFPGPYRAWYHTPHNAAVAEAHDVVRGLLGEAEAEGRPFEGFAGFSQGAAVALSLCLTSQHTGDPPPVKFLLIISSPLPFAPRTDIGIDCRAAFSVPSSKCATKSSTKYSTTSFQPPQPPLPTEVPPHLVTPKAYLRGDLEMARNPGMELWYNMWHANATGIRVGVPSVHVYGTRDEWYAHSVDVAGLCEGAVVVEHGGGHEIPREVAEEVVDALEEVVWGLGLG